MTDTSEFKLTDDDAELEDSDVLHEPQLSILDQLTQIVQEEVSIATIEIAVIQRKGITVLYSPNIESKDLKKWRNKATNKKTGELDNIKFSGTVILATCEGLLLNGEPVVDSNDNAIVFNSQAFADMMEVDMPEIVPFGIKEFFNVDAHLEGTALTILDKAGYGEDIEVEDPTNNS
jgi:hypothetical protein